MRKEGREGQKGKEQIRVLLEMSEIVGAKPLAA